MGIILRGDFKDTPEYRMGYLTLLVLREDIAACVSKEFGDHYADMPMAVIYHRTDKYNKKTEELIRKYKPKERFLAFLYASDIKGKLSPYKCKALLDGIRDLKNDRLYGYTAYPKECMKIEDFKALLNECWERKKYLIWS